MRLFVLLPSLVLIAACTPVKHPTAPPQARMAHRPKAMAAVPPPNAPVAPAPPAELARATITHCGTITFEGVAFDSRRHHLVVADQAGGPGTQYPDAATAGRSRGGLAAVNGGFFTPTGEPLGWVIAAGKRTGSWNSASSLGSGIWHANRFGQSAIMRREVLGRSGASTMLDLLQAGPLLVENGHGVASLDPLKSSVRTLILWDGGHRWWFGRASACTLAELGSALTTTQPAAWPVRHALNLDGGRSSDLWISPTLAGNPVSRRTPWNRPVRNFLILIPN